MEIGKKLKLLRGNMTQAELARRSGVDKAILSKIEAGKMSGTVKCHTKLAEVFGLKLSEFYAYLEKEKSEPVEFHSGISKSDFYQNYLEILTKIPVSKKMLPTLITLKPNESKFLEEATKDVERFIIILEGKIEIGLNGKVHHLEKKPDSELGDSLYSMSSERHTIKNVGNDIARALCVSSPPVL